jgi:hypothetical protein
MTSTSAMPDRAGCYAASVARLAGVWCVLMILCGAFSAAAQDPKQLATAEALFREGRRLFDAGQYQEACPKLQASYDLDPGLGTLLNLARCYTRLGKTARAWALYVDLENLADREGQADRRAIAREQIAALEPKLMRLAVVVPTESQIDGLVVSLDGAALEPASYGTATPRDPGRYEVTAAAPRKQPWSHAVDLVKEGATVTVTVPPLVDAPESPPAPAPVASTPPPRPAPPVAAPPAMRALPEDSRPLRRTVGFVVGGVGLGALVVSAALAGDAASRWSNAACSDGLCATPEAQADAEQALLEANVATGFLVGGATALGVGTLLVVTALGSGGERAALRIQPFGVRVEISF